MELGHLVEGREAGKEKPRDRPGTARDGKARWPGAWGTGCQGPFLLGAGGIGTKHTVLGAGEGWGSGPGLPASQGTKVGKVGGAGGMNLE